MEYKKITHKKAVAIIDGIDRPRKVWVKVVSYSGSSIVYERNGSIMIGGLDEDDEETLLTANEAKSSTWWLGEGPEGCVLEARSKKGKAIWAAKILIEAPGIGYIEGLFKS